MNKRRYVRALSVLVFAGTIVLASTLSASAHVEKSFGPVDIEMGFGTEPAYAGQPNSVYLGISRNGKPVTDLTDTLKVKISFGTTSIQLPLVPNFEVGGDGTPGDYRAWFIPSQPGPYTFHVSGTVDGTKVDWTANSSPSTFDTVQSTNDASFPKVTAPTNQQLADLMTQQTARSQASIDNADSAAKTARTVGLIGVVLGAIGVIAGIGALSVARKRGPESAAGSAAKSAAPGNAQETG